jgi:hypothetical protein
MGGGPSRSTTGWGGYMKKRTPAGAGGRYLLGRWVNTWVIERE